MSTPKIYVPRSKAKSVQTPFGEIICLGFHAESLIAFVRENTNGAGYINFNVAPRRTPDEQNTHSIYLDTWQPGHNSRQVGGYQRVPRGQNQPPTASTSPEPDDVPF